MSFNNFSEFCTAVYQHGATGELDNRLRAGGIGASESVPSEGGFLVPGDFATALFKRTYETGAFLSRVFRLPVDKGNKIKVPIIDEKSRADGSRLGGLRAYWVDEGVAPTTTKPKLMAENMTLHKMAIQVDTTAELLEDAAGLDVFMREAAAKEFAFRLEDDIINGDGSGKPKGIIPHNATITVSKESGQAANTIQAENVINMWSRCWGSSRKNAIWLINQDTEPQLMSMSVSAGTAAIPIYTPASGPFIDGYPSLFGRPVIPVEYTATLGTEGDIILFDPSQIMVAEKEPQSFLSMHVHFVTDEGAFKFTWRTDGQPLWHSPLTPKNSVTTVSPYVVLGSRS